MGTNKHTQKQLTHKHTRTVYSHNKHTRQENTQTYKTQQTYTSIQPYKTITGEHTNKHTTCNQHRGGYHTLNPVHQKVRGASVKVTLRLRKDLYDQPLDQIAEIKLLVSVHVRVDARVHFYGCP